MFCLLLLTFALAEGAVWPTPASFTRGMQSVQLAETFQFECHSESPCPDPLPKALSRFRNVVFFNGQPSTGTMELDKCIVKVESAAPLRLHVDESYTLKIDQDSSCSINANTQWGALRGLHTFSQVRVNGEIPMYKLPDWDRKANSYTIHNISLTITDAPRFPWRGVLLDTSRHYLTMASIFTALDAMEYNKLNTLHWHVTDDNSWPLVIRKYPRLSEVGAYAPDAVYTMDDVKSIVTHAFERGIRVIPEFDVPAHASVWGKAYPNLTITCDGGQTLLNPTGPVYDVLDDILDEFQGVFDPEFIHFGGDEVRSLECWEDSKLVRDFMKQKGIPDVHGMRNYFETQVQQIAQKHKKDTIFWEEVFDKGYDLQSNTVVNVWLSAAETKRAVKHGNRVVHSYGWYLDQQVPPGPQHYLWVDTWQNFFLNDPLLNSTLTPKQQAMVLGGEASQWGEQVDASNIQSRMWPRACGTAQRLWAPADVRDVNEVAPLLSEQRCYMLRRGIGAGPFRPANVYGYCTLPEHSRFLEYRGYRVAYRQKNAVQ